jgi:photosystem II stability/assembly factor-like uncharacterized protein
MVFAAGLRNIYRAGKLGKTWTLLTPPTRETITGLLAIPNSQSLLLSTKDALFLSKDEGTTWARLTITPSTNIRVLRVTPDGKRWGFLSDDGVSVSSNSGKTWPRFKHQTARDLSSISRFRVKHPCSLERSEASPTPRTEDATGIYQRKVWVPVRCNLSYGIPFKKT